MSTGQIILIIIAGLVIFRVVRRFLLVRSITHYLPSEVSGKLKSRNIILLDVRSAVERSRKNIKGSIHIPLPEINTRTSELNKFQNMEIVCFCETGRRSLSAVSKLKKHGYNAANLKGGMVKWNLAGVQ